MRTFSHHSIWFNLFFAYDDRSKNHIEMDFKSLMKLSDMSNHFVINKSFRSVALFINAPKNKYQCIAIGYTNKFSATFRGSVINRIILVLNLTNNTNLTNVKEKYCINWCYGKLSEVAHIITPTNSLVTYLIHFSNIVYEQLNGLYNTCDFILRPLFYDGFSLTNVVFFASGLPIVTSMMPTIEGVSCDAAVLLNPPYKNERDKGFEKKPNKSDSLISLEMEKRKYFAAERSSKRMKQFYQSVCNLSISPSESLKEVLI